VLPDGSWRFGPSGIAGENEGWLERSRIPFGKKDCLETGRKCKGNPSGAKALLMLEDEMYGLKPVPFSTVTPVRTLQHCDARAEK
jgi:hypothetical protein